MIQYEFTTEEREKVWGIFEDATAAYGLTVMEADEQDKVAVMVRGDVGIQRYYAKAGVHPDVAAEILPPDQQKRAMLATVSTTVCRLVDKMDDDMIDGPILVTHFDLKLEKSWVGPDQVYMYFIVHFISKYFRD